MPKKRRKLSPREASHVVEATDPELNAIPDEEIDAIKKNFAKEIRELLIKNIRHLIKTFLKKGFKQVSEKVEGSDDFYFRLKNEFGTIYIDSGPTGITIGSKPKKYEEFRQIVTDAVRESGKFELHFLTTATFHDEILTVYELLEK